MVAFLLLALSGGAAAFVVVGVRVRRHRTGRQVARRNWRADGVPPYAGQRPPEKLNPGLGGFGGGGGG